MIVAVAVTVILVTIIDTILLDSNRTVNNNTSGNDDWIALSVTYDHSWKHLQDIVDDPVLKSETYATFQKRKENESTIDKHLSNWFASKNARKIMFRLQEAGITAGKVSNNRQLLLDPHLNDRDFFVDMDEPLFGVKRYDGQSIRGNFKNKDNWETTRNVGENSQEILMELLGYTSEDCERLEKEEIVLFQ